MRNTNSNGSVLLNGWSHRWYGFWRTAESDSDLPRIEDAVRENIVIDHLDGVVSYLENTPIVLATSGHRTRCLFCDEQIGSSVYRSDGVWLWPDDLSHYVRVHEVALPEAFVEHIRNVNYIPPDECRVRLEDLPWPR